MSACPPDGGAKCSAAAGRKAVSASRSNCRRSTPAPDESSTFDASRRRRFPRRYRLTLGAELEAVARHGKRYRFEHLEARVVIAEREQSRVGFIVPKHGQSAVSRNRLRRRLREHVRLELLPQLSATSGSAVDVVIRARAEAYRASLETIRAEMNRLLERVHGFRTAGA